MTRLGYGIFASGKCQRRLAYSLPYALALLPPGVCCPPRCAVLLSWSLHNDLSGLLWDVWGKVGSRLAYESITTQISPRCRTTNSEPQLKLRHRESACLISQSALPLAYVSGLVQLGEPQVHCQWQTQKRGASQWYGALVLTHWQA